MNVNELLQLDIEHLKNVDWGQVQKDVLQRKDSLIIVILLIATPLIGITVYSNKSKESKVLASSLVVLEEKLAALESMEQAKREFEEFAAQFPDPIPDDRLIDEISHMADQNNIQILTISPLQHKQDSHYSLTTVNLNVVSKNISDMRSFFKTLEESPYPLRIDGWSVRIDSPLNYDPQGTNSIRSTIDIASLKVNR